MQKEIKELMKPSCPNIHYFGAPYRDGGCIDGFLHDLDDSDEPGTVNLNDQYIPCPFCNSEAHIEYIKEDMCDQETEMDEDGKLLIPESVLIERAKEVVENYKKMYL